MTSDDQSFLYSSWLRSFRASKFNVGLAQNVYYDQQAKRIDKILARGSSRIIVASDDTDDSHIFGYVVFEVLPTETILHYVYVKQALRGWGIGKALLCMVSAAAVNGPLYASHLPANEEIQKCLQKNGIVYYPEKVNGEAS